MVGNCAGNTVLSNDAIISAAKSKSLWAFRSIDAPGTMALSTSVVCVIISLRRSLKVGKQTAANEQMDRTEEE